MLLQGVNLLKQWPRLLACTQSVFANRAWSRGQGFKYSCSHSIFQFNWLGECGTRAAARSWPSGWLVTFACIHASTLQWIVCVCMYINNHGHVCSHSNTGMHWMMEHGSLLKTSTWIFKTCALTPPKRMMPLASLGLKMEGDHLNIKLLQLCLL